MEQKPTRGPPQVSSQQSIQPPEAAEGEGQRPRVPLERVELLERPLGGDPGTAQVCSPASQRMAACNPRELGGTGRETRSGEAGIKALYLKGKGKDVGTVLRLEESQGPITGKARGQRAVHLPSPTACRMQGRPERGLPGHAGPRTLVIVERKRPV